LADLSTLYGIDPKLLAAMGLAMQTQQPSWLQTQEDKVKKSAQDLIDKVYPPTQAVPPKPTPTLSIPRVTIVPVPVQSTTTVIPSQAPVLTRREPGTVTTLPSPGAAPAVAPTTPVGLFPGEEDLLAPFATRAAPGITQLGEEGLPSVETRTASGVSGLYRYAPGAYGYGTGFAPEDTVPVSAVTEVAPTIPEAVVPVTEAVPQQELPVIQAPPTPEEVAAVQVRQSLAVQTLSAEGPNWWDNLSLVTKAAEQPPLISPEEYDQRVAVEQAQSDRSKYLDQQLTEQMKTPDQKVLEWLGQQPPVPENLDSQLQGLPVPGSEPSAPTNKRKLVASGINKMVDSLAKDGKLPMLSNRLNSIITGVSSVRPQDDGRVVAIVAKAKLDPEIMSSVIADISRRMTQRVPGMIPFGSLGPLPELVRL